MISREILVMNIYDVLVKSNDGILFWWTGTEFIKCSLLDTKFTKSDDLVE